MALPLFAMHRHLLRPPWRGIALQRVCHSTSRRLYGSHASFTLQNRAGETILRIPTEESAREYERARESQAYRVRDLEERSSIPIERIRNFSIIAHVDHGKSTLADKFLHLLGDLNQQELDTPQMLDSLQVERERGITVRAQTASLFYRNPKDSLPYLLNLIDTPGHVDFSYEVSRSLAACQGVLLLVDSTQGIQAQTLANLNQARRLNLDVIPVISKVDLPSSDPQRVADELLLAFDIDPADILLCSAKSGRGILDLLPAIIDRIRPPGPRHAIEQAADPTSKIPAPGFRALVFDSWFDIHRGVVCLVQVTDGVLRAGDTVKSYHAQAAYEVQELGFLTPKPIKQPMLRCGQVGYIIANIRVLRDVRLGETFYKEDKDAALTNYLAAATGKSPTTDSPSSPSSSSSSPSSSPLPASLAPAVAVAPVDTTHPAHRFVRPLPGFVPAKSVVFAGIYPANDDAFEDLQKVMDKILLTDASIKAEKEVSHSLGTGYRCGFLGILHKDVFVERLEKEFQTSVVVTAPTVVYQVEDKNGEILTIDNPSNFPPPTSIRRYLEPIVKASIICPDANQGVILELCQKYRGQLQDMVFLSEKNIIFHYIFPLNEIVTNFYDRLKSVTAGYASFDYEPIGFQDADVVKLDIRVNGELIDAMSTVCPAETAQDKGRAMVAKLRKHIERQQFDVVIQAMVGSRSLARERISPYRKDVLTTKSGKNVGGGDRTRKLKLLEAQKEGKKKMKMIGSVEVPQEAFIALSQND